MSAITSAAQARQEIARLDAFLAQLEADERALEIDATPIPQVRPAPVPLPEPANDAGFAFVDYGKFYDFLRSNRMLGPKISADEFAGCDAIIKACAQGGWPVSFVAYGLATAFLETAGTMQPIKEKGGPTYFTRMYDINGARPHVAKDLGNIHPGDGVKFAGRGYVQLTGRRNYTLATAKLRALGINVDLIANPDDAMRPDVAAAIMVMGMAEGWFTSRRLSDDLQSRGPSSRAQFKASRDIINGKDRDDEIAGFAVDFQTGLMAGGYKIAA
jgi:putative chitinase